MKSRRRISSAEISQGVEATKSFTFSGPFSDSENKGKVFPQGIQDNAETGRTGLVFGNNYSRVVPASPEDAGANPSFYIPFITGSGNINFGYRPILGGRYNENHATDAIVSGGQNWNKAGGARSLLIGNINQNDAANSIVSGRGNNNKAGGNRSILSGTDNVNSCENNIVSGSRNSVEGAIHTIVSGANNKINRLDDKGTLKLGYTNLIVANDCTINTKLSAIFGASHLIDHTYGEGWSIVSGTGNSTYHMLTALFGQGLTTKQAKQTIVGTFNRGNASARFQVGNGTADTARSTAFEVLTDGGFNSFGHSTSVGGLTVENSTNNQSIRKRLMACAARELKNSKGNLDGFIVIYPESDLTDHLMATYDISFCPYSGPDPKLGVKASVNAYVFKEANKDALVYMGSADIIGSLSNVGNDIKPKIMIAYSKDRAGYFIVLGGPASVWRYHLGLSCDVTVTNNLSTVPKFGIKLVQSLDEMITYYNDLNKGKTGYTPITELTTYEIPDSKINRLDSNKTPTEPYDLIRYKDISIDGSLKLVSSPHQIDSLEDLGVKTTTTKFSKTVIDTLDGSIWGRSFMFSVINSDLTIPCKSNQSYYSEVIIPRYSKGFWVHHGSDIALSFITSRGSYFSYYFDSGNSGGWTSTSEMVKVDGNYYSMRSVEESSRDTGLNGYITFVLEEDD